MLTQEPVEEIASYSNDFPAATSQPHDIDNHFMEDTYDSSRPQRLFNFPSISRRASSTSLPDASSGVMAYFLDPPYLPLPPMISPSASLFSLEPESSSSRSDKGKAVSRPIPILTRSVSPMIDDTDDAFSMFPAETSSDSMLSQDHGFTSTNDLGSASAPMVGSSTSSPMNITTNGKGKGKARDIDAPTLPPLSFTPMEVGYGRLGWPSSGSPSLEGPSPLNSIFSVPPAAPPSTPAHTGSAFAGPSSLTQPAPIVRPPSRAHERARSMSNLSVRSTPSIVSKIRGKLSSPPKSPTMLAKKLLSRRRESPAAESVVQTAEETVVAVRPASPPPGAFRMSLENLAGIPVLPLPSPPVHTPIFDIEVGPIPLPLPSPPLPSTSKRDSYFLKRKSRSYSSPYPLTNSVLDVIPTPDTDVFQPISIPPAPSPFESLPRELRLQVLLTLIRLHLADFERMIRIGKWTALKAASSKFRYVGNDKAIRELVRLSRVSTSWQSLAYDGQLWSLLDLRSFHRISSGSLLQLTKFAGSFVQQLNLSGHVHLSPETMESLADQLCITPHGLGGLPFTQLTTLNLRGCSAVSTRVLHHLLVRSPMLQRLSARGLSAVTNTTCDILAVYCPRLKALDLGRCSNLDASGLRSFFRAILERGERTHLTELRVSGMRNVNSDLLTKIARGAPDLEVLDLSYAKGLHDGGLRAFVTCSEADVADEKVNKVLLSSRQAGHDPADPTRYWRRVMRIRHLSLSFCTSLTDAACRHLAHALPRLEFLELAGIGAGLREEGLIHLLRTTSLIRKLDLEDASSLEDSVLDTLTPPPVSTWPRRVGPFPGDLLEHLSVSHSVVSDDALVRLIEGCAKLRVLEADNTRMSGRALQTFVKSARTRGIHDALVVAGDNRNVGESSVRELQGVTRPRLGWRAWDARKLNYLDSRDGEGLEDVGQDECDSARVVVKTFYSWQTVDAVRAARKRRARSRRRASWEDGEEGSAVRSARWWSPGGARRGGTRTPTLLDARDGGEACVIM